MTDQNEIPQQDVPNTQTNWLEEEASNVGMNTEGGERLPTLKFEENKIVEFTVDFSNPFGTWIDSDKNVTKAIIPVTHKGEKKNLWLNKKNPLYAELVHKGREGQTTFKVIQVGNQSNTKYNLVE